MLKIGITGGIGSGKSTITKHFASLGIPVYNTDERIRYNNNNHPDVVAGLKALFGDDIYFSDGTLDRWKMADIIFNDKLLMEKSIEITGKALKEDYEKWITENSRAPYVLVESAIFYERNFSDWVDFMVGVNASLEVRIKRGCDRDKVNIEKILERIKNQTHEENMTRCDYVIENDENYPCITEVMKLHKIFSKISELEKTWKTIY